MAILTVLRIPYHVGRLALFAVAFFPYFQWKTWKAKSAFKNELLKNGIPLELAGDLANIYGNSSRIILRPAFRRDS